MSIRNILAAEIVVFVALLSVVLGATIALAGGDNSDALYVNIAGRQRMLSQRAAKEALLYSQRPTSDNRAQLETTLQLFNTSHRALRLGGQTPANLDGTNPVWVTGASDDALINLLNEVDKNWKQMSTSIDNLFATATKRNDALVVLKEKNPALLRSMDTAVRYLAAEPNSSATVINIAGRQRMLSQRTAMLALLSDSEPSEANRTALSQSIALFERSHKGLRAGGKTGLRLDGSRPVQLTGTKSGRAGDKLDEVEDIWRTQREALDVLAGNISEHQDVLSTIISTNPKVLSVMNAAVARSQAVAEEKLALLQSLQLGALIVGLIVALLGGVLAVNIGSSLKNLKGQADRISQGEVEQPVQPVGIGEVRALSQSFERMRFSLSATMEILEKE
ncbi:MAG: type IV pili methyl-accepting chemotaxis transducer N-terminal domain-containing protein [Myxococcota bacterium]